MAKSWSGLFGARKQSALTELFGVGERRKVREGECAILGYLHGHLGLESCCYYAKWHY